MYLPIPNGGRQESVEDFKAFLPDRESLDTLQKIQYDHMVAMFQRSQPYAWTGGHHGVTQDYYFRGEHYLKDRNKAGTYCTGVALEHWFLTYLSWMEEDAESEYGITYEQAQEIKAYFFVHADPLSKYDQGCGKGIIYFKNALEERLKQVEAQSGEEAGDVASVYSLSMEYHTDIYNARFGDYIQIQSKDDIHSSMGGHCGVFVGLERPVWKGSEVEAVRIFNAAEHPAYGKSGVGMNWFLIDKMTGGYKRVFHCGSMREV